MVFLISAEETARTGLVRRLRNALSGAEGYKIESAVTLGMRIRRVTVMLPPSQNEFRQNILRAVAHMRRERAGRIIFSNDFKHKELFLREGFNEMELRALMTCFAGQIAARVAGGNDGAVLFARQMAGDASRTLLELAEAFRYVMAVTDSSAGAYFRMLRQQTGVSIIEHPSALQLSRAGVAVFFDAPAHRLVLPAGCVAIGARAGALESVVFRRTVTGLSLRLSGGKDAELPHGFPKEPLIAAALAAGTLKPEDAEIVEIFVSDSGFADWGT